MSEHDLTPQEYGILHHAIGAPTHAAEWCRKPSRRTICVRWTDLRDDEVWVSSPGRRRPRAMLPPLSRSASGGLPVERQRTKADDGRRTVLHERAAALLREQRDWLVRAQHPGVASGRVFPGSREGEAGLWLLSHTALGRPLLLACAEARCPELSPHALRRACEDAMRAAGVDEAVRRAHGGWRSREAHAVYQNASPEERADAARAQLRLVNGEEPGA